MSARDILLVFQAKHRYNNGMATVFCPSCKEDRECKQKEYWRNIVGTIKNVQLSSYCKCQTCHCRFPAGVDFAGMTPSRALERTLLVAMVRLRGANGRFQRHEAKVVREGLFKLVQHPQNLKNTSLDDDGVVPSEDEIKMCSRHMKSITQEAGLAEDILPYMVEKLTEADKKLVVRGMACVSLNNKKLEPKEAKIIDEVGTLLGLGSNVVSKIIKDWTPKDH